MDAQTNRRGDGVTVRADYAAFERVKRQVRVRHRPDHRQAIEWFDEAVRMAREAGALPARTSAEDLEIKCRYAAALNRVGTDRSHRTSL
jgi:hypothetical protein